jgi:hypothetical protein
MTLTRYTKVAKGCFSFGKRFDSLVTLPKPSKEGLYPLLCVENGTSLTPFYGVFFFSMACNGIIIFIFEYQ